MKYRVFDIDNKAEYTKEMSFDELKDYFEPDVEIFGEEMHDKWEEVNDVDDLREYLEYKADGMRFEDGIEVIPDDMDILLEDNCTNAEAKKSEEESLLNTKSKEDEEISNKIEIVKYIVSVKLDEKKKREDAKKNAEMRQRLLEIKAKRQDAALENMSDEELDKTLAELSE